MNAILPRQMPKVRITRSADAGSEAFLARLHLRLHELADDLRLPGAFDIAVDEAPPRSPPRLRLGDRRLGIPQSLARQTGSVETQAIDLAERVAAALQSARWQLIAPHLWLPTEHLRAACELGLNLDDLQALAPRAHDATECAWAAC